MVHNAHKPIRTCDDVLLILGPYPYTNRAIGYFNYLTDQWMEKTIAEDYVPIEDCYVAGWMELPDIELWKDQLLGEYEWEREHYD